MAHVLTITDGTTTFNVTSGSTAYLINYAMASPTLGEASIAETINLWIIGANGGAVQTNTATLEQLLESARRRRMESYGPRVYLQVQLDSDGATWRSEIYDARLDIAEDGLAVWANAKLPASLYIERAPYWEGALTQLTLTNGNGTNNTSGLTIYNHDDGDAGNDNWCAIDAAEVTGNLPTPVKLELTNTAGGSRAIYQVFAACNAFNTPGSLTHIIEGESTITGGGSTGAAATCSNGNYATHSGSGTWSMQFTLSSTIMGYCAGYPFHVLARFHAFPNTIAQASILSSNGAVLASGEEISLQSGLSQALIDFGVLYLPPGGYQATWAAHKLKLGFRQSTSQTVQVDYIGLFPAYSFRDLLTFGTAIANNDKLTDDGIEGQAYTTASSVNLPEVIQRGGPLTIWPNRDQRLYFAWSLFDHSATIADTLTVKAWYRPRRAAV
jgi:hypothetical protein